jgi:hypothetical protein
VREGEKIVSTHNFLLKKRIIKSRYKFISQGILLKIVSTQLRGLRNRQEIQHLQLNLAKERLPKNTMNNIIM